MWLTRLMRFVAVPIFFTGLLGVAIGVIGVVGPPRRYLEIDGYAAASMMFFAALVYQVCRMREEGAAVAPPPE